MNRQIKSVTLVRKSPSHPIDLKKDHEDEPTNLSKSIGTSLMLGSLGNNGFPLPAPNRSENN